MTPVAAAALHVLFIGNSLTSANDLPGIVAALGRAAHVEIRCETVSKPNFSLEDHWNDGEARRAIARGGWDVVVLQQGPSSLEASRVLLVDYVKRFDREIRTAGARPAVFMVWPPASRSAFFDDVSRSYRSAAAATGAVLLPAGDGWRAAWRRDRDLQLYGPDGFHPSLAGSYLAALIIFQALTGQAAPDLRPSGLPPDVARELHAAAADVRHPHAEPRPSNQRGARSRMAREYSSANPAR